MCEPICDEGLVDCTNGQCTQPNICECNEGFVLAIRDGRMACEPKPCDRTCVNGFCVGNDQCSCQEGYRKSPMYDFICEPVCGDGCVEGVCIAPGLCVCKEGFSVGEDGTCQPLCTEVDCSNGVCLGNDQCLCNDGFQLKRNVNGILECAPLCGSSCLNGRCIAPGHCECDEGYQLHEVSDICEPLCNPPCTNGECVEPDLCTCYEGFVPENEELFDLSHVCVPFCDPKVVDCSDGYCVGNNLCQCNDGFYSIVESGVRTCLPVPEPTIVKCDVPTTSTTTVQPECICETPNPCPLVTCPPIPETTPTPSCDYTCPEPAPCPEVQCPTVPPTTTETFKPCECATQAPCPVIECPTPAIMECPTPEPELKSEEVAQYICDDSYVDCSHGTCLGNNICECNPGYRRGVGEQEVIVCEPVCEKACVNGICVAPEVCECFVGYADHGDGLCRPICEEPCVNGECIAPNVCRCSVGYEEEWDGMCRKKCEPECRNGICLNGECVCDEGYVLDRENVCSEVEVENVESDEVEVDGRHVGVLQSTFHAECEDGYEMKEGFEECVPVCDDCDNGSCVAPGECECLEGFVRMYTEGEGSCNPTMATESSVEGTSRSETAEMEAAEQVEVHREEQFSFISIFNRTHLLIAAVSAAVALVLMLLSYWVCSYMSRPTSIPTETMID